MSKMPWLKWYPRDWRNDVELRLCSIGARGLLAELMGIAHESRRYGHVLVNGTPPTTEELAVLCAVSVDECAVLLEELETRGVMARDGDGALYSRRMVRDENKRKACQRAGRKGVEAKQLKSPPSSDPSRLPSISPLTSALLASDLLEGESEGETQKTPTDDCRELEKTSERVASCRTGNGGYAHAVDCPECGHPLKLIHGRNGPFYMHPRGVGLGCKAKWDAEFFDEAAAEVAERRAGQPEPEADPRGFRPLHSQPQTCPMCGKGTPVKAGDLCADCLKGVRR